MRLMLCERWLRIRRSCLFNGDLILRLCWLVLKLGEVGSWKRCNELFIELGINGIVVLIWWWWWEFFCVRKLLGCMGCVRLRRVVLSGLKLVVLKFLIFMLWIVSVLRGWWVGKICLRLIDDGRFVVWSDIDCFCLCGVYFCVGFVLFGDLVVGGNYIFLLWLFLFDNIFGEFFLLLWGCIIFWNSYVRIIWKFMVLFVFYWKGVFDIGKGWFKYVFCVFWGCWFVGVWCCLVVCIVRSVFWG